MYMWKHIPATPNTYGLNMESFILNIASLKATEKWNLLHEKLDSLCQITKAIFALAVFNSSYFISYFQKEKHLALVSLSKFRRLQGQNL